MHGAARLRRQPVLEIIWPLACARAGQRREQFPDHAPGTAPTASALGAPGVPLGAAEGTHLAAVGALLGSFAAHGLLAAGEGRVDWKGRWIEQTEGYRLIIEEMLFGYELRMLTGHCMYILTSSSPGLPALIYRHFSMPPSSNT